MAGPVVPSHQVGRLFAIICKNKHHPHHAVTYTQVLVKDGSLIVKAKELAENVEVDLSKLQPPKPPQT